MKKEKCFDIGTIQAFTDGELASDITEKVIRHIALCDNCANLLTETEDESAFAFSALDNELNVLVPTERLRTKLFESIRENKVKESWRHKIAAGFGLADGFGFNTSGLVAFASVLLLVGALAIGVNFYRTNFSGDEVAVVTESKPEIETIKNNDTIPAVDLTAENKSVEKTFIEKDDNDYSSVNKMQTSPDFQMVKATRVDERREPENFTTQKAIYKTMANSSARTEIAETAVTPTLSGEDSYLQTIATLNQTAENNKDSALRPTERVAFERDMAMVDDSIKKLKQEVRKNPKNQAAREVLRMSYQNKIELLNSVAEKNELMATIR